MIAVPFLHFYCPHASFFLPFSLIKEYIYFSPRFIGKTVVFLGDLQLCFFATTMLVKKLGSLPSRSGRHLQRYNHGCRLVVGCIPYRLRETKSSSPIHGTLIEELEVLLITSQKSPRMMFPKGGWEIDEDIKLAATRETLEEAGVVGTVGDKLGEWIFKSRSQDKFHEGYMFPMLVTEEFDVWPEKEFRQRIWMTVNEAREVCAHSWMREALDAFCSSFHASENKEGQFL